MARRLIRSRVQGVRQCGWSGKHWNRQFEKIRRPMWQAMFAEQIPPAEKILRTIIVYALIAVLFRLTGKRGLASMNTFDVVVIFLLSNVVQNAIIGNDTSLTGGIFGAATLVAINTGVNRLIAVNPQLRVSSTGVRQQ
jgi:hypothetical protein